MKTYTKKEADILIKYYSLKIVGKPVSTKLSPSYKITSIEIDFIEKDKAVLYCIGKYNFDVFKRSLIEYTEDFNLKHPDEVLIEQ